MIMIIIKVTTHYANNICIHINIIKYQPLVSGITRGQELVILSSTVTED